MADAMIRPKRDVEDIKIIGERKRPLSAIFRRDVFAHGELMRFFCLEQVIASGTTLRVCLAGSIGREHTVGQWQTMVAVNRKRPTAVRRDGAIERNRSRGRALRARTTASSQPHGNRSG